MQISLKLRKSKTIDEIPLTKSGLSKILIDSEKICWSILSFKNDVPLAIADEDIALAKELSNPLAILLSKIMLILSLSIFFGLSFAQSISRFFFSVRSWNTVISTT